MSYSRCLGRSWGNLKLWHAPCPIRSHHASWVDGIKYQCEIPHRLATWPVYYWPTCHRGGAVVAWLYRCYRLDGIWRAEVQTIKNVRFCVRERQRKERKDTDFRNGCKARTVVLHWFCFRTQTLHRTFYGSVRKDPAGTIQWRQSFRGWRALRVTIFPFHDTTRTLKWNTSSYIFYLVISSDSIKWKGF